MERIRKARVMTPIPMSVLAGASFFIGAAFTFGLFCYIKLDGNDFRAVAHNLMYTAVCMLAGIGLKVVL